MKTRYGSQFGLGLIVYVSIILALHETSGQSAEGDRARPNILFFLADDQRYTALGCAGHPIIQTPTMDRLARQGVRFENAFVTTSICAASRASIFTGLHERTHGYTFGTPPIAEPLVEASYPVRLREAGYRTGFVGKFGVNTAGNGQEAMFDSFVPLFRNPYFKKQPDGTRRHLSEIIGDRAIEFLEQEQSGDPFCLSISFNAPHAEDSDKEDHYPWPKAVDDLYTDVEVPPPELSEPGIFESQPEFLKESMNRKRWFWRWDTPEKYDRNIRAYYRMISGIDHVMSRVLTKLDELGLAENTVVIFSSDNGYYAGSRGFAGKWSHYEESLRVPLIIYDPRLPEGNRGRVLSATALNIDIPATMLELAGAERPGLYQGRSLVRWLNGKQPGDWRSEFFSEHLMEHPDIPKWEGVRGERWKYARYFGQEPPFEFLHDLEEDPKELNNLAGDAAYEEVLNKMRGRCDELLRQYRGDSKE